MATAPIPYIDPTVQHVGISKLRTFNSRSLRDFDGTLVIQENDRPLAVLLKYDHFLRMQYERLSVIGFEMNDQEVAALLSGLRDLQHGRTKTIAEVRASLEKKGDA